MNVIGRHPNSFIFPACISDGRMRDMSVFWAAGRLDSRPVVNNWWTKYFFWKCPGVTSNRMTSLRFFFFFGSFFCRLEEDGRVGAGRFGFVYAPAGISGIIRWQLVVGSCHSSHLLSPLLRHSSISLSVVRDNYPLSFSSYCRTCARFFKRARDRMAGEEWKEWMP